MSNTMQHNEVNGLKYWQKKYFMEGIRVLTVLVFICLMGWYFCNYGEFLLIFGLGVAALAYKMLHSLRDGLQTRAELLIWEKRAAEFGGLVFDVGLGADTEVLLAQNVVEGRQARECHNVLKTTEYMWEEDIFYTEQRLKYFTLRNTAFAGVILSIKADKAPNKTYAEVRTMGQKVLMMGTLKSFLDEHNSVSIWADVLRFFKAEKMRIEVANGRIYCWIKTSRKLFYQFSLVGEISPLPFISRVQQIKQMTDKLAETLRF